MLTHGMQDHLRRALVKQLSISWSTTRTYLLAATMYRLEQSCLETPLKLRRRTGDWKPLQVRLTFPIAPCQVGVLATEQKFRLESIIHATVTLATGAKTAPMRYVV